MKTGRTRSAAPSGVMAACLLAVIWAGGGLRAGVIEPDLRQRLTTAAPGEEIPVIVDFSGKVDLSQFHIRGNAGRGRLREGLVRALRSRADSSQSGVVALLKKRGSSRQTTLWLTNRLAVLARPAVIFEVATQPGVAAIRLDAAVPLAEAGSGSRPPTDGTWRL